jgi:hypothetical protein
MVKLPGQGSSLDMLVKGEPIARFTYVEDSRFVDLFETNLVLWGTAHQFDKVSLQDVSVGYTNPKTGIRQATPLKEFLKEDPLVMYAPHTIMGQDGLDIWALALTNRTRGFLARMGASPAKMAVFPDRIQENVYCYYTDSAGKPVFSMGGYSGSTPKGYWSVHSVTTDKTASGGAVYDHTGSVLGIHQGHVTSITKKVYNVALSWSAMVRQLTPENQKVMNTLWAGQEVYQGSKVCESKRPTSAGAWDHYMDLIASQKADYAALKYETMLDLADSYLPENYKQTSWASSIDDLEDAYDSNKADIERNEIMASLTEEIDAFEGAVRSFMLYRDDQRLSEVRKITDYYGSKIAKRRKCCESKNSKSESESSDSSSSEEEKGIDRLSKEETEELFKKFYQSMIKLEADNKKKEEEHKAKPKKPKRQMCALAAAEEEARTALKTSSVKVDKPPSMAFAYSYAAEDSKPVVDCNPTAVEKPAAEVKPKADLATREDFHSGSHKTGGPVTTAPSLSTSGKGEPLTRTQKKKQRKLASTMESSKRVDLATQSEMPQTKNTPCSSSKENSSAAPNQNKPSRKQSSGEPKRTTPKPPSTLIAKMLVM